MAYYDAVRTQWASLPSGDTTAQKLEAINAATVAGPNVDVPVGSVVGYLALQGKLSILQAYAADPPAGANAQAVTAAREMVTLLSTPSVAWFETSQPAALAAIEGFLTALSQDANTGIAGADATALLALAQTRIPWWQSAGYTSPISQADLDAAGGLS